ncbi:MAG: hypothetical protein LBI54_04425 [Lachnospiraceae bacterium]|jgi:hypothetical protein|nr:hypothetical protein [Lachnospiraceae bacterium]
MANIIHKASYLKGGMGMYSNISNKIKALAQVIAWVGIIGSVILGFYFWGLSAESRDNGAMLIVIGFVAMIGGSLFSWISSFSLYGFGELIEKTTEIAVNTAKEAAPGSLAAKMENDEKMKTLVSWRENNLISEEEFEIKKQALLKGE